MSEMSDQQRAAAAEQSRELRESGAYMAAAFVVACAIFWAIGAVVLNVSVLPNLATWEAMTCR